MIMQIEAKINELNTHNQKIAQASAANAQQPQGEAKKDDDDVIDAEVE